METKVNAKGEGNDNKEMQWFHCFVGSVFEDIRVTSSLVNSEALDLEYKVGVGWNIWRCAPLSIGQGGGNGETTFASSGDTSDTNIPALDHFADAEFERERFALLVGYDTVSDDTYAYFAKVGLPSNCLPLLFSLPM